MEIIEYSEVHVVGVLLQVYYESVYVAMSVEKKGGT